MPMLPSPSRAWLLAALFLVPAACGRSHTKGGDDAFFDESAAQTSCPGGQCASQGVAAYGRYGGHGTGAAVAVAGGSAVAVAGGSAAAASGNGAAVAVAGCGAAAAASAGGAAAAAGGSCGGRGAWPYVAIAYARTTGRYGVSWNHATAQDATRVALQSCGQADCGVVTVANTACAALAVTAGDAARGGYAFGPDRGAVEAEALRYCQAGHGGACFVKVSVCSG